MSRADSAVITRSEPAGDPGLFGPESVTWRIHSDAAMTVGGFRALYLQALHPLAMAGFSANSRYFQDPWGRLERTGRWLQTVTFGTTDEARAAGEQLRGIHRRLQPGIEPETGQSYRVDDPELLRWVHVTEVESFLTVYRRSGGNLTSAEADRYVDEMRQSAELVGLDRDDVPSSVAGIHEYYEYVRPQLRLTAVGRRTVRWSFVPSMPRWVAFGTPARPAWAALMTLSAAMLPDWARKIYGLPGWRTTDAAAAVTSQALRVALGALPESLRWSPIQRAAFERVGLPAAS